MAIKIGGAHGSNNGGVTASPSAAVTANLDTLGSGDIGGAAPVQNPQTPPSHGDLFGQAPSDPGGSPAPIPSPAGTPASHFQPTGAAPFLMTGSQQHMAVEQVRAQQALRDRLRGGAREFFLNPGEFARLYFLDGTIIGNGVFDTPMVVVHLLQIGGNWVRFVCNRLTEGRCVCCESNADMTQPMTSQLFTVINTTPYVIQNGRNKGQTLTARLQLFAAMPKVRERLMQKAADRGGTLAGKLWKFSRSTKQDARTGDDIEYVQDIPMQAVLAKYPKLGENDAAGNPTATRPLNYSTVYPILTNEELARLRPDLAGMAGWAVGSGAGFAQPAVGSTSSVGELGAGEIPF